MWHWGAGQVSTQLGRILKVMVAKRGNDNFAQRGDGGKLGLQKVSQVETDPGGCLKRKRRFCFTEINVTAFQS